MPVNFKSFLTFQPHSLSLSRQSFFNIFNMHSHVFSRLSSLFRSNIYPWKFLVRLHMWPSSPTQSYFSICSLSCRFCEYLSFFYFYIKRRSLFWLFFAELVIFSILAVWLPVIFLSLPHTQVTDFKTGKRKNYYSFGWLSLCREHHPLHRPTPPSLCSAQSELICVLFDVWLTGRGVSERIKNLFLEKKKKMMMW